MDNILLWVGVAIVLYFIWSKIQRTFEPKDQYALERSSKSTEHFCLDKDPRCAHWAMTYGCDHLEPDCGGKVSTHAVKHDPSPRVSMDEYCPRTCGHCRPSSHGPHD